MEKVLYYTMGSITSYYNKTYNYFLSIAFIRYVVTIETKNVLIIKVHMTVCIHIASVSDNLILRNICIKSIFYISLNPVRSLNLTPLSKMQGI